MGEFGDLEDRKGRSGSNESTLVGEASNNCLCFEYALITSADQAQLVMKGFLVTDGRRSRTRLLPKSLQIQTLETEVRGVEGGDITSSRRYEGTLSISLYIYRRRR